MEDITITEHELHFKCPDEQKTISTRQLNDIIPDCKFGADEPILHSLLTSNFNSSQRHLKKGYKYCYGGHPLKYPLHKECMYEIDNNSILQTCRNGQHLKNCSNFNCENLRKFKCPEYYCVPMHYVCDGKVDCPKGKDEVHCQNRICMGLCHCANKTQCIS